MPSKKGLIQRPVEFGFTRAKPAKVKGILHCPEGDPERHAAKMATIAFRKKWGTNYRQGRMPRWFRSIQEKELILCTGHPWLDHIATAKSWDGSQAAVVSPYVLTMECMKDLIAFCKTHNLEFHIGQTGLHFTGYASNVSITQKENVPGDFALSNDTKMNYIENNRARHMHIAVTTYTESGEGLTTRHLTPPNFLI